MIDDKTCKNRKFFLFVYIYNINTNKMDEHTQEINDSIANNEHQSENHIDEHQSENHHDEHRSENHHDEHQSESHHDEHQSESHHDEHQSENHHDEHQSENHHDIQESIDEKVFEKIINNDDVVVIPLEIESNININNRNIELNVDVELKDVKLTMVPITPVLANPSGLDNIAADLTSKIIDSIEKKSVDINNIPIFVFYIMNLVQNVKNLTGDEKKKIVLRVLETIAIKYNIVIDWTLVSNMIDFTVSLAKKEMTLTSDDVKNGCLSCLKTIFNKKQK